jgi:two-component system sensor histidine kinase KdpD
MRILPAIEKSLPTEAYIIGQDRYHPIERNMQLTSEQQRAARWVLAVLAPSAATTLLAVPGANATTAGLVYLVLVVWFATLAGFWLSLFVAIVCAAAFDYFFLLPFHTFQIAGSEQWLALGAFLVCCIVVSRVAELARQQKLKAEQRRADVERLYALSQEMMLYEDAEKLLGELPGFLRKIFFLDSAVLYVCGNEEFYSSAQDRPMGIRASLQAAALGPQPTQTTAGDYIVMPLMLGLRAVGALGWKPDSLSREVASAIAAQVAIAVARSMAIEETARLEAAREAERLRTALTDSLTHELRTPLTSIRAAATTLLHSPLDEEGRIDMASIIDEESARLDLLIGEAVEMAEIDAHSVHVHLAPHSLRQLLEQAVEASQKNLSKHSVTIDVTPGDDAPVWFDAHLLSRVLRHLLENAAAHTPPGTPVKLEAHRSGARLEFTVEDSGPGIDPRDLPRIFEKFYRGKRRTAARKGSGMGLAIARAILIAHGGGIEATNATGHGAHFHFWVPLVEKAPE